MWINGVRLFSLLFTCYFTSIAISKEQTVYRWVDERNIVHYSQHQPAIGEYTKISTLKRKKYFADLDKNHTVVKPPVVEQTNIEETPVISPVSQKKCELATDNLHVLSTQGRIRVTDANGIVKLLTDVEIREQIKINKHQVKKFCKR